MLQEYLVTHDGENTIPLTVFEDLTQVLKKIPHTNFRCTSRDIQN